ncbi:MAG: fumarylacetoacetate hydrolase family protein [Betaproteobacteria bacterium]|nr:MAG: fumarylacetoacetate hydrolase family protein [Betaproteobacteria bacterium]
MDNKKIATFGDELFDAWRSARQIAPLTDREAGITIEDAYRVQMHTIERRIGDGERVVGKKIGITAKAVMQMLKVDQPDFGHLLSGMTYNEGESLEAEQFCQPRGEGEIAFILNKDLSGPGITGPQVLAATECVMPAFEIVDSRVTDWKIKIQDTVADNASAAAFVLGDNAVSSRRVELATCGMVLEKNGEVIGTGAGAASLGNPVNAVAWLANKLGELGIVLKAGEVILSGSLSIMFPIQAGDVLRMSLNGIGNVSCRFV